MKIFIKQTKKEWGNDITNDIIAWFDDKMILKEISIFLISLN